MNAFYIFIVRVVVSIVMAFFICRFFFPGQPLYRVLGLAAIMLGLAYLFQYTRKRDREDRG
ncbi:MAG: hypothetical protein ACOWYE_18325 [Desulfatiglandales bacterium]